MEQQNRQKKMNPNNNNNLQQNTSTSNNSSKTMNDLMKHQQQQQQSTFSPGVISRERSFVRNSNQQNNMNNNNNNSKRRSLAFNLNQAVSQQSRNKPAMDIYRPPKLNNSKLQHSSSSTVVFPSQQSYSNSQHMMNRRQAGLSLGSAMPLVQPTPMAKGGQRPILAATQSHPISPYAPISQQVPLITSPSSGNIIHQAAGINRVKFAVEPEKRRTVNFNNYKNNNQQYLLMQPQQQQQQQQTQYSNNNNQGYLANGIDPYNNYLLTNPLQRSKSLSSADVLTRSIAGLGLGLGTDITDIGQFPPEIQLLIDNALDDPNQLNSRCLMELSNHFIMRAVEGRRYALPIARCCLSIIAKEHKETFLEALLNTCRQRYQEREKWLFAIQGMKSPSRVRFTAFMAFLTEMFCQLKRRQLQLRTQCEGVSPPLVLLTLLAKCCEDCVKPPVRSLSEIDCLFYVLTCVGQDLEQQLPQQLQGLLSLIRDAFLNAGDSAPVIRRTLLQLIELQASHWQLPGNTVLYYYPAAK